MKKKICIYISLLILMISIVSANVDINIDIATDGEANIYANPNSIGDTNYYIDGVNFEETINGIDNRFEGRNFDIDSVLHNLGKILIEYDYRTKTMKLKDYNDLKPKEQKFRAFLDAYIEFKLQQRDTYYNNKLNYLNLEVLAIERTMDKDELCESRMKLGKDLNFDYVICDNVTYYNRHNEFIGLKFVNKPIVNIIKEKTTPQNLSMNTNAIKRYQKLCDDGLKQFCKIIEQQNIPKLVAYTPFNVSDILEENVTWRNNTK